MNDVCMFFRLPKAGSVKINVNCSFPSNSSLCLFVNSTKIDDVFPRLKSNPNILNIYHLLFISLSLYLSICIYIYIYIFFHS